MQGAVTAPRLRGAGGLSQPHRLSRASSCQHLPADHYPTVADGWPLPAACTQTLNAFPQNFTCDSLNVSCRDHRVCNQPGTEGTALLPITPGKKPPATPSGRLWTRFYCHKCFVQEQQYPPEGAVLSSEICSALAAPSRCQRCLCRPTSPHMVGIRVAPGSPQSDQWRRGQASRGPCNF